MIVDYDSQDFREYWQTPSKAILHDVEQRIVREFLPNEPGWFLDLGAGFGRLLPAYYAEDRRIVLVDYSVKHLRMAEEACRHPNVDFIAANAYRLPFRDSVFSMGICIRLLHHLDRPEAFARELSRVFARGGHSVISYMNKRSLLRLLRYGIRGFRRDHALLYTGTFGTHPAHFRDVFAQSGFTFTRLGGAGLLHQVVTTAPVVERALGGSPLAKAAFSWLGNTLDRVLGGFSLALMQYLLLRKESTGARSPEQIGDLQDILACPGCGAAPLQGVTDGYKCGSCHLEFEKIGKVLDFRYPRGS